MQTQIYAMISSQHKGEKWLNNTGNPQRERDEHKKQEGEGNIKGMFWGEVSPGSCIYPEAAHGVKKGVQKGFAVYCEAAFRIT